MPDKIWDSAELTVQRFACDCGYQGHNLEIAIERLEDGRVTQCKFNFFLAGKPDLKWRIKEAYKALKGKDIDTGDFILRLEDIPELVNFVVSLTHTPNTSGT